MAWVWTGSADISATLVSAGASATSNFAVDVLTIPSGLITTPLTGAILVVAAVFEINPSANLGIIPGTGGSAGIYYCFVDTNGTELVHKDSTVDVASRNPYYGAIEPHDKVFTSAGLPDALMSPTGLNGGGSIRLLGSFVNSVNETLTGTLVAAIWDSTNPNELIHTGNNGTTLSPVTGNAPYAADAGSPYGIFDRGLGDVVGIAASPPATTPNFALATSWANLVARTNGAFFAALGDYSGAPATSVPFDFTYPSPVNVWGWGINAIRHGNIVSTDDNASMSESASVSSSAVARTRSFGVIIG